MQEDIDNSRPPRNEENGRPIHGNAQSNYKDEKARLQQLKEWRDTEIARQRQNRVEMAIDADYYDGRQLSQDTLRLLEQRRQLAVIYNEVKQTIDWLSGTERRTRFDFSVLPRVKADETAAQGKTKLLKYLNDENASRYRRSEAFKEAAICGISWIETGLRNDPDNEPIYERGESWRNVVHDSSALERDYDDARFVFRRRCIDLDIAIAVWPEHEMELTSEANARDVRYSTGWYNGSLLDNFPDPGFYGGDYDPNVWRSNPRKRVWIWEGWYYEIVDRETLAGSTWDPAKMRVRCTVFIENTVLHDDWTPYAHNCLPFTPLICYRRWIDGQPYGVVRNIRSPQDALNKRMQKAVHAASTRQVLVEKSAINEKLMPMRKLKEEAARPDGMMIFEDGALSGRKVEIRAGESDVQQQLHLAAQDRDQIRNSSGVTGENLGQDTNAVSGKAILAKQSQGSMVTAELFDAYHWTLQKVGEIELALVEQTYSQEKQFRLTGERNSVQWVSVNAPDEDGIVRNAITSFRAQFVMAEQDYRASVRQAMFDQMGELLGKLATFAPQAVMNMLDIWLDYSDVPGKDAIVKRIRELTGQTDPDEPISPEQQQAVQARKQQEAMQQQLAADTAQANLDLLRAQIRELQVRLGKLTAETVRTNTESAVKALEAGNVAATVPHAAAAGDEILRASGFQDAGGIDPNIPGTTMPAQQGVPA